MSEISCPSCAGTGDRLGDRPGRVYDCVPCRGSGIKPDDEWRERAACVNASSDTFFITRGNPASIAQALEYCAECPVTAECLDYIMALPGGFRELGVWGGTTPAQRRRLAKSRPTVHPQRYLTDLRS